ncbi:site-specific DNA-methyltransferase [Arthrobacter sp. SRS-W-1-2016]|uniref:site-specific DNA-methyltransferase n=1 Tax=Arthrobacter sp. SRS-W-1-2016 TaxID=1930254 RepID=UPI000990D237|nr:site-specific DNA-methyltransferase [Arthrobacter sp. SRS-W-1-2016]OOP63119.1 site-specific DNA-methyltransferase [Arthrobacter sp. SRS-W-1-2016]
MIRDVLEHNEAVSPNDFEIARIRAALPEYFDKNGSFMFDRLQESLRSGEVTLTREGYELKFLGKSYAKYLTSTKTGTVVVPDLEHNSEPPNAESKNLYVVGDNLDALKHLLGSYSGQAKCIYIDPPYNTGSDGFVYNDDFGFNALQLVEKIGLDEDEASRIIDLRGKSSHSAWLTFMYPRLELAKEMLADDGVLFVSIDDNEQFNLRALCDEVFGEENWLGNIVWKNATDNNPTQVAIEHEYVLVYCKSRQDVSSVWKSKVSAIKDTLISIGDQLNQEHSEPVKLQAAYSAWFRENKWQLGRLDRYKYIDAGGVYTGSQSVHNPGREGYRYDILHPITQKPCKQPLFGYRFPEASMSKLIEDGKILFGKDESKIVEIKVYAREYSDKLDSVIELDGRAGATEVGDLFGDKVFTNPKPSQLLTQLLDFVTSPDDIVFDFFSGSATTADATMQLNATDGGSRRYVLVQLPEAIAEGKPGWKQGYRTIDEIGRDRIHKAAAKIQSATGAEIDYGFRLFRLEEPNGKTLDQLQSFDPAQSDALFSGDYVSKFNLNETPGRDVVLATWLLQDGHGLTDDSESVRLVDYELDVCDDSAYIIEPGLTSEDVMALVSKLESGELDVSRVVVFGYSVEFSVMHELKKNLSVLKSGRSVSVLERF